jgi:MFS family permease
MDKILKDRQYYKFCLYGFLKNLRFFDAFFILFLLDKGISFSEIGILYAVREIMINIFEIPSGIIADTYGKKKALMGSFVFYILSFLVFYFSQNFWLFLFAFVLYGMADAFRSGTHKTMIIEYLKLNNRGYQKINYYGHTRACSQKGSALSALIAGIIVFFSGDYQFVFLISIIPYVLNFILIGSYPKELNKKEKLKTTRLHLMDSIKSFMSVVKRPNVLQIIHSSAVFSAFQKAIKDYIQPIILSVSLLIPFVNDVEIQKKNALLIGLVYFIIFLLTSQASRYASRLDNKTKRDTAYITLIYGFLFGVASGLLFVYNFKILALIVFIGIYLIENIRKPVLTGVLSDNVPTEILTSVISAQSQWKTILTASIALILGVLTDYLGMGWAFVVISFLLLLASVVLTFLKKKKSLAK